MIILLSSIALSVVFILLLIRYMQFQKQEEENEMIALHLETERAYYSALARQAESIRQYRHDLAGHIRTLEYLLKNQNQQELMPYLEQLQLQHSKITRTVYSNNEVINALIDGYQERCAEKGIDFFVHISTIDETDILDLSMFTAVSTPDNDTSRIRIVDFCALLNNLLENAVEECDLIAETENGDQRQRKISLSADQQDESLSISVKNSIRKNHPVTFKSEKANPGMHGIGNTIIHRIIESCNGTISDTVTEDQSLTRTVMLPLAKESEL